MYCTNCGKEIDDKAVLCVHCGVTTTPLSPAAAPNATAAVPKIPRYEKESYIMNATAGSMLMWFVFQFVIAIAITFICAFLILLFASNAYSFDYILYFSDISQVVINITLLAATIGASLFSVLMFKGMLRIKLPIMKHFNMSFKRILYYTAIGMGLSALASYGITFLNYLLSFVNIQMTTADFSLQPNVLSNILLVLTTCIAAPIFEELLFRGLILTALKRFGNMFAIIITSLLFALAHGNIPQAIPVFFLSLVLCYVTLRSKSLLPSITIHFINNVLAMVFTFSQVFDYTWIISIVMDVLLILFAFIMLFIKRKQIKSYIQKHKGTPLLSYFKHWAPIVYTLASLLMIALSFTLLYSI